MRDTLSMSDLEKHSENIYEAIIILGKRARQINTEQKQYIEREAGIDDSIVNEDDDDYYEKDNTAEEVVIKLPKPTDLAIKEMIAGKLKYDYGDDVENEQTEQQ